MTTILTDSDLEDLDIGDDSKITPLTDRDIAILDMQEAKKEAEKNSPELNKLLAASKKLERIKPLANKMPKEYAAAEREYKKAWENWTVKNDFGHTLKPGNMSGGLNVVKKKSRKPKKPRNPKKPRKPSEPREQRKSRKSRKPRKPRKI